MQDGSGQRGFHALTLGEAGSAAIRDGIHAQLEEHFLNPLLEPGVRDALEFAKIFKIFADSQAWIEADVIQQRADASIDMNRTLVRLQHSADHAQRGGFAGAVRSQKAGNFSIGSAEGKIPDGWNRAKGFFQVAGLDHSAWVVGWGRGILQEK